MKKNKGKQFLVILLIIGAGVLVSVRGGPFAYGIFFAMLLVPLCSWLYIAYVYFRFCIYQIIGRKTVVKLEQIPYTFILANEDYITYTSVNVSFSSLYSKISGMQTENIYCLLPGDRTETTGYLTCHLRGEYLVGIDKVTIRDYLGLYHLTYRCPSQIRVKVLPRVIHLSQLIIAPSETDEKHLNTYGGMPEIPDGSVREYAPGDAMHRIHWKASAHSGELMTRTYTEEPKPSILLVPDLSKPDGSEETVLVLSDKMIEALLSVADYFLHSDLTCSLLIDQDHRVGLPGTTFTLTDSHAFEKLYSFCSSVAFRGELTPAQTLGNSTAPLGNVGYLVIFTSKLGDALVAACSKLLSLGKDVTLLYFAHQEDPIITTPDNRLHFYRISYDEEPTQILEQGYE